MTLNRKRLIALRPRSTITIAKSKRITKAFSILSQHAASAILSLNLRFWVVWRSYWYQVVGSLRTAPSFTVRISGLCFAHAINSVFAVLLVPSLKLRRLSWHLCFRWLASFNQKTWTGGWSSWCFPESTGAAPNCPEVAGNCTWCRSTDWFAPHFGSSDGSTRRSRCPSAANCCCLECRTTFGSNCSCRVGPSAAKAA